MTFDYYGLMFNIAAINMILYSQVYQKHNDHHISLFFLLTCIQNLGYVFLFQSHSIDEAYLAIKVQYIAESYVMLVMFLCVFKHCRIELPHKLVSFLFALNTAVFLSAITFSPESENALIRIIYDYDLINTLEDILLNGYFIVSVAAIIYANVNKNNASRFVINSLLILQIMSVVRFSLGNFLNLYYDIIPFTNVLSQFILLRLTTRVRLYEIDFFELDSISREDSPALLSFDSHMNYLGCNLSAELIVPEILDWHVDKVVASYDGFGKQASSWLESFEKDNEQNRQKFFNSDKIYIVKIHYLYVGKKKKGYQLVLTDDTDNQKYIALIDSYNDQLQKDVTEASKNLLDMQNKLVLGMAVMIESRDDTTGGHVRRTSDAVRLIVEEMYKDKSLNLDIRYCADIILAAPMHDLGKIAIDDALLRKPGRFTPEEFEIMKSHAAEGGRIVHSILNGIKYVEFKDIAENIANYHHECWDGSGYPKGLKGEEIPLEARIMAIADVYDALVSKRSYKEGFDFERANNIIMEGMGTHFDEKLLPYYLAARPALEEYYRTGEIKKGIFEGFSS